MSAKLEILNFDGRQVLQSFDSAPSAMDEKLWSQLDTVQKTHFEQLDGESRKTEWSAARRSEFFLQQEILNRGGVVKTSSVAHCLGSQPAVMVAASADLKGVGIDIEQRDREISLQLLERICQPEESLIALHPIEFWVVKEALFKCYRPNKNLHLRDFVVSKFDRQSQRGEAQFQGYRLEFRVADFAPWVWAMAWH